MAIPSVPINSTNFPDLLERGIRDVVFNNFAERVGQYEALYNIDGSVKFRERDVVQGGLGQMVPTGEGQPATMDSGLEAWVVQYLHQQWTLGMRISQIAKEDELYGVAGRY